MYFIKGQSTLLPNASKHMIHGGNMTFCRLVIAISSLSLLLCPLPALTQDKSATGDKPKRFYSVLDLKQKGTGPVLIGGREAKSTDFPAIFYSKSGNSMCTASMVSSKVLLLAAHCVPDGGSVTLSLAGKSYQGKCTHAPGYKTDKTADWALCLLGGEMTGLLFENVNMDAGRLKVGTELLLSGFGCTKKDGTGGNDGKYRIGEATVAQIPSTNNDIVTSGDVVVCYGDSGGPAFLYLDPAKQSRVVVSVNSRTEVTNGQIQKRSFLSSTSTKAAGEFLAKWSGDNKATICGVSPDAANCRR